MNLLRILLFLSIVGNILLLARVWMLRRAIYLYSRGWRRLPGDEKLHPYQVFDDAPWRKGEGGDKYHLTDAYKRQRMLEEHQRLNVPLPEESIKQPGRWREEA